MSYVFYIDLCFAGFNRKGAACTTITYEETSAGSQRLPEQVLQVTSGGLPSAVPKASVGVLKVQVKRKIFFNRSCFDQHIWSHRDILSSAHSWVDERFQACVVRG